MDRESHRSADQRTLPFRMRADLQVVAVAVAGHGRYVLRDPVTQEVFELTSQEHGLLQQLRQPTTLKAMQQFFERRFAPLKTTSVQLQHFVQRLYEQGLLLSDKPGQGEQLFQRGSRQRRKSRLANCLQVLSVRLGGVTPDKSVERLARLFGWLFSPLGVLAAIALGGCALVTIVGRGAEFVAQLSRTSELFAPQTLPLWILAVAGVKVAHELGHAVACRRFGGHCQEIGVLLLAGLPTLYCDVTDAWRLPSKWRRMAVSAAGMYVELLIASTAAMLWNYAEPGMFSSFCINLIIVCSVGTLLVNANPLLRYDGYYLLSDLLEVPNLAERARGLWSGAWRRFVLGEPPADDPLLGPHKRLGLRIYALASKFYLALVLTAVFAGLLQVARPHQLQNAVYTFAALALLGLLAAPVLATGRMLKSPVVRRRIRWLRLGGGLILVAAAAACLLAWPLSRRVEAPLVVVPANAHPLFAAAAGNLAWAAAPGVRVESGEVVVRLRDPEIDLAILRQQGEVEASRTQLAQLQTLRAADPDWADRIPTAAAQRDAALAQLAELQAAREMLTLRAPASGIVIGPPEIDAQQPTEEILPGWEGSPLDPRNRGAWIEPGVALASIAEGEALIAWAAVDQADVGVVQQGQPARLVADQSPTSILNGRVTHVARRARRNRPTSVDPASSSPRDGDRRYHVVEIAIDPPYDLLMVGARGEVKIRTEATTVGQLLMRQIHRFVRSNF